jgi:hypothetical protein
LNQLAFHSVISADNFSRTYFSPAVVQAIAYLLYRRPA